MTATMMLQRHSRAALWLSWLTAVQASPLLVPKCAVLRKDASTAAYLKAMGYREAPSGPQVAPSSWQACLHHAAAHDRSQMLCWAVSSGHGCQEALRQHAPECRPCSTLIAPGPACLTWLWQGPALESTDAVASRLQGLCWSLNQSYDNMPITLIAHLSDRGRGQHGRARMLWPAGCRACAGFWEPCCRMSAPLQPAGWRPPGSFLPGACDGRCDGQAGLGQNGSGQLQAVASILPPGTCCLHSLLCPEQRTLLCRFLNALPANRLTATALDSLLRAAGFRLHQVYRSAVTPASHAAGSIPTMLTMCVCRRQFIKLLMHIVDVFLPALSEQVRILAVHMDTRR